MNLERNAQKRLVDMNALVKIPLSMVKNAIKVSSTTNGILVSPNWWSNANPAF